jgi:hypothetical protein
MRNHTLFIVGAGASSEAGLPTGKGLIDIIATKLDFRITHGSLVQEFGDYDILDVFQQHTRTREGIQAYLEAAWRVRDGIIYSNSIDSFMDVHRDDPKIQLCGKLAIVKSILEAEQKSKLFIPRSQRYFSDLDELKKTWFFNFAKNINDGVRKTEIARIFDKVSFVVFNYDRCFEHFMFHALQSHYGISDVDAGAVMKTLKIIHPYGTIGDLPWQDKERGIPFGFFVNRVNMEFMASRIKTYSEQLESKDLLGAISGAIRLAHTLVFLGFSYHPENMKLLASESCTAEHVFGTAKDISASNIAVIVDQLRGFVSGNDQRRLHPQEPIFIRDLACADLLQEYSRTLFFTGRK